MLSFILYETSNSTCQSIEGVWVWVHLGIFECFSGCDSVCLSIGRYWAENFMGLNTDCIKTVISNFLEKKGIYFSSSSASHFTPKYLIIGLCHVSKSNQIQHVLRNGIHSILRHKEFLGAPPSQSRELLTAQSCIFLSLTFRLGATVPGLFCFLYCMQVNIILKSPFSVYCIHNEQE